MKKLYFVHPTIDRSEFLVIQAVLKRQFPNYEIVNPKEFKHLEDEIGENYYLTICNDCDILLFVPYPGNLWVSEEIGYTIQYFKNKKLPCYFWSEVDQKFIMHHKKFPESRILSQQAFDYYEQMLDEYPVLKNIIASHSDEFNTEYINGSSIFSWLRNNWVLWKEFEQRALKIAKSKKRYSARTIIESIRWETDIGETNSYYKINNNRVPELPRLFMYKHPQYSLFEQRKSQKRSLPHSA